MATATGRGRKLTPAEIARYAYEAGFRGDALVDAVAVALAESGGVVDAHNPKGEDSRGLWQINVNPTTAWGRERAKKYPNLLTDPAENARAAFEISGGGKNFKPWTTYAGTTEAGRNSSHSTHLPAARAAAQTVSSGGGFIGGAINRGVAAAANAVSDVSRAANPPPPSRAEAASVITAQSDGTLRIEEVDELPDDASPQDIENYIRKHYPQAAPYLANPEIRALLLRPDIDDIDEVELEALIRGTTYWQTHSAASRAYDALIATDGNEAGRITDRAIGQVSNRFSRLGIVASPEDLGTIAKNLLRSGVINLDGAIADEVAFNQAAIFLMGGGATPAGEVAFTADQLAAMARQYLVPLSRQQTEKWAKDMATGAQSKESFESWLTGLAKAKFSTQPDIVSAIEKGMAPSQYFQGHIATVANLLELDETQIDLMDPRWHEITETVNLDGSRRAPTLGEVAGWARRQEQFKGTRTYKTQEAEMANNLSRFFGAVA